MPEGLRASVGAAGFYTNNFYYQSSGEEAAQGFLLRPQVVYLGETRKVGLFAKAAAEYGMFSAPRSEDDYLDGNLGVKLALTPTLRNRFYLDLAYALGHDPFGIDRTENSVASGVDLDQWRTTTTGGRYRYGAPGARINGEIGVSVFDKQYTTNRSVTDPLGYTATTVDYQVFYNYSPKTIALLDFSRTGNDFDEPFPGQPDTRSGPTWRTLVGVKWLATAKSSGDVRVGYRKREFDNGSNEFQGLDWSAGVQWSPTVPWVLELKTGRSEAAGFAPDTQTIDVRASSVTVTRSIDARSKFKAELGMVRSSFFGNTRVDNSRNLAVNFERRARERLYWVGDLGYNTRDSNAAGRDFSRWSAAVGLRYGY